MSTSDAHADPAPGAQQSLSDAQTPMIAQAQITAAEQDVAFYRVDLGALAGFEHEEVESLYARALDDVRHGLITPATRRFLSLIALYPHDARFIRGLGLCYHHQRMWGWAETVYLKALSYDADDGITMALLAEVTLYTDGKEAAHRGLSQVVARGAKNSSEAPYVQRAQAILNKIKL